MCGIVGYVGRRAAAEILVDGLRQLEYRGYDSSGIATFTANDQQFHVRKAVGRIESLAEKLRQLSAPGSFGIGHTRWATHGAPTENNAHPHFGGNQVLTLVHNGVIENYAALKERLLAEGYRFQSSTDTEVVAHLIASCYERVQSRANDFPADQPYAVVQAAVSEALSKLRGTYALAIIFRDFPQMIVAARLGSPLVVGIGRNEQFIASDAAALAGKADKIVYLTDHQMAFVTADSLDVIHRDHGSVTATPHDFEMNVVDVALGGYPHYMLKEIFEQPESIENALRGRIDDDNATAVLPGLNLSPQELRKINRIILTGCGTSWHAALVGEYLIEELARIPVEVEYASELRYRNPPVDHATMILGISQSGETADTLGALREMKRKGHPTQAICNVIGSTIAQECDGCLYLHAGPEIGVASTKAFTSQVAVLALLALYFGRSRHLSYEAGRRVIAELRKLPWQMRRALELNADLRRIAEKYQAAENFLYLGRNNNFPSALEGALKLKEISYIHAEGYPAAEMKHGPIALVDQDTPSVFIMPQGFVYDKVMSNLEEIKARGGPVIAIAVEGDKQVGRLADDVVYIPPVDDFLSPIITSVPLQLLAYHIAVLRGCDVDKPRNLAKSVTVE